MAARVLEISKYENGPRPARARRPGRSARLYRFPYRTAMPNLEPVQAEEPAPTPKSRFRLHLAVELAIGLLVWLTWFLWQHMQ